jgi:Uma2 family endonuclease
VRATTALKSDEPEIEIIDGRGFPKVSPKRTHAVLQGSIVGMFRDWAGRQGTVGTEWRFHLSSTARRRNSFVPDVAYVSAERLRSIPREQTEEPPFAPDVAIEIFSPGHRERNLSRKIERYLECGAKLVLDVRPSTRTIVAHDKDGARVFTSGDDFEHASVPGLRFSLAEYFAEIDLPD